MFGRENSLYGGKFIQVVMPKCNDTIAEITTIYKLSLWHLHTFNSIHKLFFFRDTKYFYYKICKPSIMKFISLPLQKLISRELPQTWPQVLDFCNIVYFNYNIANTQTPLLWHFIGRTSTLQLIEEWLIQKLSLNI